MDAGFWALNQMTRKLVMDMKLFGGIGFGFCKSQTEAELFRH